MAKAKTAKKVLYHAWFEGENVGEADAFYEIVDGKLKLVTCWSANDAMWREEYMSGLLAWAGVDLQSLPSKHRKEAEKLLEKTWGLDYEEESQREEAKLYFQRGTSDKVYHLSLFPSDDDGWTVDVLYGRRNSTLRQEVKCEGEEYETAKKLYDKILKEKLNKGYKQESDDFEDEEL